MPMSNRRTLWKRFRHNLVCALNLNYQIIKFYSVILKNNQKNIFGLDLLIGIFVNAYLKVITLSIYFKMKFNHVESNYFTITQISIREKFRKVFQHI